MDVVVAIDDNDDAAADDDVKSYNIRPFPDLTFHL